MKVELSIKASYLSDWGVLEGIRELVQNAKDAESDGFPMSICSPRNGILRIKNEGVSLSHKVLLFGHTTKEGRDDQIGQFGEGLKLGILALVRANRGVKIYSGDEIWTPFIDRSKTFDEDVLCFKITKSSNYKEYVRIDIDLNASEWEEQKKNFLFIHKPKEIYESHYGSVILNPEYAGKVFVKGIFVQEEEDLQYGYNLKTVDVDRDRRMVRNFDLEYYSTCAWKEVATTHKDTRDVLYDMLKNDVKDIKSFEYYSSVSIDLLDHFISRWQEENGEAFPVLDSGDVQALNHLGASGVIVSSKPLANVLWEKTGKPDDIKDQLMSSVTEIYKLSDLSTLERINYLKATNIVSSAIGDKGADFRKTISVVKFNDKGTLGQFKRGEIFIGRVCLSSCSSAISTLAHEAAHFSGGDGHKGHIDSLETIWENIAKWFLKE